MSDLETSYAGRKSRLFWLAIRTAILTVITAGFYRFWMKTRLRRYYWSAIRPGGTPLEYMGDGWEKLLGFLFAVVIMAFYIGVVNLLLMFFSFTLFQNNFAAYALSFLGVLPLIFFAQYRARRYILARTRWRGIRFGLEPGAWGYTWRAALHWLVTIVTAGLLWPRMTFWLEKYRIDRTYFGDHSFHQGGRWTMLLGAMKHVYIGGITSAAAIAAAVLADIPTALLVLFISIPWTIIGLAYWRAHSFRLLSETKELGGAGFSSMPRTGRILGIYSGGYTLASLVMLAGLFAVAALFGILFSGAGLTSILAALEAGDFAGLEIPTWAFPLFGMAAYFSVFLVWGAASQAFVKLPLAQHFAETLSLTDPNALTKINQRARDEFAEAEGFADALDVGAAL